VVTSVAPGALADAAKLTYDMKVLTVNDLEFTPTRLREAVENSPETGEVRLTVSFSDRIERNTIRYREGRKFPRFKRLEERRDILSEIMKRR